MLKLTVKIDTPSLMEKAKKISLLNNKDDIERAVQIWNPKIRKAFLELAIQKYDIGESMISDQHYDIILDYYLSLGGEPLIRVKPLSNEENIPVWLSSLDKVLEDKIESWLSKNQANQFRVSDKLDGISLCIIYTNGLIDKIYTKGINSGKRGSDLTHLLQYFHPSILRRIDNHDRIMVRGELIITKENFKSVTQYKNPRNMVAGITKRKLDKITPDFAIILGKLEFVTYEIMSPRYPTSKQFELLESYGFSTVDHHHYDTITKTQLDELLMERRMSSPYDIDGIVIMKDNPDEINTLEETGNPDYAIAYKMCLLDQLAETTVVDVEWNPSKHGQVKPRIQYKPVIIAGETYQWTSGFNARFIQDNKIGPGTKLIIVRSGDVNPYIKEILSESTTGQAAMPTDHSWHWNKTNVDILLDDIENNEQVKIKRLANFCKEMGIKGIGEGTTAKFVNNGWDLDRVLSAKQDDFKELDRVGDKMSSNLYNGIQGAIKNVPLGRVMVASGMFGMGIGTAKVGAILENYPDILDRFENYTKDELIEEICQLDGFAIKTATNFYEGLIKFEKFMELHAGNITIVSSVEKNIATSGVMAGELVVMTGFRNAKLKDWIERMGGRTSDSPSAKMTILIVKDLSKGSGTVKFKKAQALGVDIYQMDSFISKYRINI
jgi:DNA ligase (NAD+)